jgi:hypothetical protein
VNICGQATKGAWGMSWRQKTMTGVEDCEKSGVVVKQTLIPEYPNQPPQTNKRRQESARVRPRRLWAERLCRTGLASDPASGISKEAPPSSPVAGPGGTPNSDWARHTG